jgi:DNA-binding transcriptional ArsR family regulator
MAGAASSLLAAVRLMHEMGHPLRAEVLVELRDKGVTSPARFAAARELSLPVVSYHFRVLLQKRLIRQTRTRPVRGATEHFYGITKRGREALARAEAMG